MDFRNRVEMVFYLLGLFLVRYPRAAILFVAVIVIGCRLVHFLVAMCTLGGLTGYGLGWRRLEVASSHHCCGSKVRAVEDVFSLHSMFISLAVGTLRIIPSRRSNT